MADNLEALKKFDGLMLDPELALRILEEIPDAIILVDGKLEIVFVNRQAELMFKYHRSELFGLTIDVLVPEEARERHAAHTAHFLSDPRPRPMAYGMELFARRKDGGTFAAEITLGPVLVKSGIYTVATIRLKRNG